MIKTDFNYFITRGTFLNEMARPSVFTSLFPSPEDAQKFINLHQTLRKMFNEGVTDDNGEFVPGLPNPTDRVWKYMIYYLGRLNEIEYDDEDYTRETPDEDRSSESSDDIINLTLKLTGGRENKYANPDVRQKDAIRNLVKQDPEYAISDELRNTMLNPDNIANFIRSNRTRTTSDTSIKSANRKEMMHGKELSDIHKAFTLDRPKIKQINIRQAAYQKTHSNVPVSEQPDQNDVTDGVNTFTETLNVILLSIQEVKEDAMELKKELAANKYAEYKWERESDVLLAKSKLAIPILTALDSAYSKLTKGISIDKFKSNMANDMKTIETKYGPNETVAFKKLLFQVDFLMKDIEIIDDEEQPDPATGNYPGYNREILDSVLKTPEDWKMFNDYYTALMIQRKQQTMDLERKISRQMERLEGQQMNVALQQSLNRQNEKQKQGVEFTPNETPSEDEEIAESYNGYMFDWIRKDLKFPNPKGKFVDRGTVKARNYYDWLMINEG